MSAIPNELKIRLTDIIDRAEIGDRFHSNLDDAENLFSNYQQLEFWIMGDMRRLGAALQDLHAVRAEFPAPFPAHWKRQLDQSARTHAAEPAATSPINASLLPAA